MAEISVDICGRRYPVACEDGQEGHLAKLAAKLDGYAKTFDPQHSAISEAQLLLMTALMVADELSETTGAIDKLKKQFADLKASAKAADSTEPGLFDGDLQAVTAELLNQAADRMERLAESAEKAA